MENAILEMKQGLVDDYYVAFMFKNDAPRFLLGKSDEFHLINENWIVIHKEKGAVQIINLNFISEIRVIRKSYK